eukprot:TRINITY_DN511_c0_g1_i1.p1 TRINITY_DN511_c0_g1~~TRINITY_DN511_c0_g1_i1.p1  ORF type:complete len:50 (-),score=0.33 TRINITY_DN511_c0_g1_i1:331-480(-)
MRSTFLYLNTQEVASISKLENKVLLKIQSNRLSLLINIDIKLRFRNKLL